MPTPVRFVGIIGKGKHCPEDVWHHARWCGMALAALAPRVALVCGGLSGVMEGAAAGMTERGGVAVGLIPNGPYKPNRHLTYAIKTGLPVAFRDIMTAASAELLIVCPGSHGTCIEAWAGAERRLPLIQTGVHHGWPTAGLPFTHTAEPEAELAELVAELLGLAP
jgi:uncharacterized protein (TIGR00725 family)